VACDSHIDPNQEGIREVKVRTRRRRCPPHSMIPIWFCAGLVPVVELAQRCGLADLVTDQVTLREPRGVNAHLKAPTLVAGMVAGADSIEDMDMMRHGTMTRLFTGVRRPSTRGRFGSATCGSSTRSRHAAGAAGRAHPAAAGGRRGRVRRYRRHSQADLQLYRAGRGVRLHRGEGDQRAAGHDQHPGGGAGDRRDPGYARARPTPPAVPRGWSPTR
jgi:hypothetical protein